MFWVFQKKNSFIKKSVKLSKIKSVKNIIIKKSATKLFQVYLSMAYHSFISELSISISISTAMLLWRYGLRKIRPSFKTLVSNKTTIWRLKKSHSSNKLLEKITSSNYHMEQKTYIEASRVCNIHTREKKFCSCYFWRLVNHLDSDRLKNLKCALVCTSLLLLF